MKQFLQILSLSTVVLLSACSTTDEDKIAQVKLQGPEASYQEAKQAIVNGNFKGAAEMLSALDSRYPFGALSLQIQLDLIYAYYKSGDSEQALATIDRFIRLNPNHKDVDYAYFMRGLTNMESESNLFQDLLNIDRSDRDPSRSKEAFNDFRRLIDKFPDSKYAKDAKLLTNFVDSSIHIPAGSGLLTLLDSFDFSTHVAPLPKMKGVKNAASAY